MPSKSNRSQGFQYRFCEISTDSDILDRVPANPISPIDDEVNNLKDRLYLIVMRNLHDDADFDIWFQFYINEKTQQEIAEEMKCSQSTICRIISKPGAKEKFLSKLLEKPSVKKILKRLQEISNGD